MKVWLLHNEKERDKSDGLKEATEVAEFALTNSFSN